MHRKIDSRQLLRQLSYELSKINDDNNYRRGLTDPDRLVPEGPDPHHH